jgi:hypothetical protein
VERAHDHHGADYPVIGEVIRGISPDFRHAARFIGNWRWRSSRSRSRSWSWSRQPRRLRRAVRRRQHCPPTATLPSPASLLTPTWLGTLSGGMSRPPPKRTIKARPRESTGLAAGRRSVRSLGNAGLRRFVFRPCQRCRRREKDSSQEPGRAPGQVWKTAKVPNPQPMQKGRQPLLLPKSPR